MSKQDAKRALLTTKNALKKKFGNTVFVDTTVTHAYEVISTGSAIIDDATGVGGLVEGKLVEIHGQFFIAW